MPVSPTHAVIAVTYRCNARCSMCDIWKKQPTPEMPPEAYRHLPSGLKEVNISGGEPLLRKDIGQVVDIIKQTCPGVRIVLSTNGLLPKALDDLLDQDKQIAVRVSIDGLGALHDEMRGINGAFDLALRSIEIAKRRKVKDIGICTTLTRRNIGHLLEIKDFAEREHLQMTFTVAHSSSLFFGDKASEMPSARDAIDEIQAIKHRLYASTKPKDWFRAYFTSGLISMLEGKPRPIRCLAGKYFF